MSARMFRTFLANLSDLSFVLLRVAAGLSFATHGAQKLFGLLGGTVQAVGSQLWIGGVIELVAGLSIAAGRFVTCAAFVASGTMAVAYTQFHWRFQFGSGFVPAVNKGELALLYCFLFFFIACKSAGSSGAPKAKGKR
jgi:putative oxidoreductase